MYGKKIAALACVGLLVAAACSDSTGFEGDQLSAAEAADLASEFSDVGLSGVSSGLDQIPQSSPAGASAAAPPISFERSYTVTRECDGGGSVTVSGSMAGELDDTRSGTVTVEHAMLISNCVRNRGEISITVNTPEPGIVFAGTVVVQNRERVSGEFTKTGVITFTASDGRTGECEIDLEISWNADGGRTVTGSFCGHEVNRSSTGSA